MRRCYKHHEERKPDEMQSSNRKNEPAAWLTYVIGRGSLLRNSIAGGVATLIDFAFVSLLVGVLLVSAPVATFWGCAVGAVTNFSINRFWTFESRARYLGQLGRYALVSGASALINSGLVGVLLLVVDLPYQLIWIVVRGVVFIGVNYPLHRYYVFASPSGSEVELSDVGRHTGRTARR